MSEPLLAVYDFLAHYRRGAAADLDQPDALSGPLPARAPLKAQFTLRSTADGDTRDDPGFAPVELYGPGDVLGIDPRHLVRTEPRDGTMNYEPNYFAGIEFDHPEFPWLFTPAAPSGDRLRPWVALLALADGAEWKSAPSSGRLPAIEVLNSASLPNLDESWAWAHVQVSGGIGTATVEQLQIAEPARVLSRLLCPRRLRALTPYTAFLVPAFDLGCAAGLGDPLPPGGQAKPAWTPGAGGSVRLPVYFAFRFHTSEQGDFESLVRALVPRVLPKEVGIRDMDVDEPGWGLPSAGTPLGLSGALRSVQTKDTDWSGPARDAFQAAIAADVNRGAAPVDVSDASPDPVVEPPLYGRWHAAVQSIDPARTGWIDVLGTDPRPRSMAGFGTRVVLAERNQLMHSAWEQVDGILKANQFIRQAQLAKAASQLVFAKHFVPADSGTLLALTQPLHARVLASPRTVAATLAGTALPSGALSPTFRRLSHARSPIAAGVRRGSPTGRVIARLARGELTPEPAYKPPEGMIALGQSASGTPSNSLRALLARLLQWQALLLALAVALVVFLALLFVAGPVIALVLALVAGAAVWLLLLLARRAGPPPDDDGTAPDAVGGGITFSDLAEPGFEGAAIRPGFRVVAEGQPQPPENRSSATLPAGATDSPDGHDFRGAGGRLGSYLHATRPTERPRATVSIAGVGSGLVGSLDPAITVPRRVRSLVTIEAPIATLVWDPDRFDEIMAAPEFPQPMYEPLRDLSQELLLPGLELIPANTLGLLEENHAFIEAYMVGLNHEMSRQLLWNNYPTDQRGSCFRQFWDVRCYVPGPTDPTDPDALRELLEDIPPIHHWPRDRALGSNANRPSSGDDLILLVRGDLLRRYPNTIVYACEAVWNPATRMHDIPDPEVHKNPQFRGTLSPDITFFGFDLTAKEALGDPSDRTKPQGWFFVFQEQPSEPRFGLEAEPTPFSNPEVHEWNDLTWANVVPDGNALEDLQYAPATGPLYGTVVPKLNPDGENPGDTDNHWGVDAAQTAFITMRRPVRVAVHAETMLPKDLA
jgi:hypothetical protein